MAKETRDKIKVAIIYPISTPYHNPFFEMLGQHPEIDLTVYFCTKNQAGRDWELDLKGFNFKVLRNVGFTIVGKNLHSFHINPDIASELIGQKFDLIVFSGVNHFTMQFAIVWCWLTQTPYIPWSESHHMRIRPWRRLRHIIKTVLYRPIYKGASACLVTGSYARKYVISYGANPQNIFVVANTPDIHWFSKESSRYKEDIERTKAELGIAAKHVILFVGRLAEMKGVQYLIEAYAKLRLEINDVCLLLVGDGSLRRELEQLCIEGKVADVIFAGFRQTEELQKYYAVADVFVLPSVDEPWGTVVNEAMACGLPVITTKKVGASGDLVKPGQNGFIVQERNVDELYCALKEIVTQPDLARAMGEMSKKIIAPWDHEHSVEEFVKAAKLACKDSHS